MDQLRQKQKRRIRRKRHIRKRVAGSAHCPRLTVSKSNRYLYVQVIDDDRGHTLLAASTLEKGFEKLAPNIDTAAKLGELVGKKLKEQKIERVVFDRNGYKFHGVIKSIADSVRKLGVNF